MNTYCTYLRVSTQRQGARGLGISAQREMCEKFIKQNNGCHVHEFMDVESGTHRDRKGLWQAIDYCQKNGCSLVIAKLDRLARDVEFTFKVINTGIDIHFTDMPIVNSMILGVFASVAQYEREMIAKRTKDALDAKKARGERTGGSANKWLESYKNKTKEQKEQESMKRGMMKNERYLASRDLQVFFKVLRNVFPTQCQDEDVCKWDWSLINTKGESKTKILRLMQDYRDMDESGVLFKKWDFNADDKTLQIRLAAHILNVRRSVLKFKKSSEQSLSTSAQSE